MKGRLPPTKKRRAKGIKKPPGVMNKTEARYAEVLMIRKADGEIYDFQFEAITLKLGHNMRLTMDFFVHMADDSLDFHDTKARDRKTGKPLVHEDALIKMKTAARLFPFRFFIVWPTDKLFTDWESQEITWP